MLGIRSIEIISFNTPNKALMHVLQCISIFNAFIFKTWIHARTHTYTYIHSFKSIYVSTYVPMYLCMYAWNLFMYLWLVLLIYIINLGCRGREICLHVIYAGIVGWIWSVASCYECLFSIQLCKGMKIQCLINDSFLAMYCK